MKLSWARSAEPETAVASAPGAVPYELAAIDLVTTSGRYLGWIATQGERTSDWLNASDEVVIHGLRNVPLDDQPSAPEMPGGDGLTPHRLKREEIIFAVPPPLPPNRHLRLHRRKVRMNMEVGDYRVSGQLHVRPGADAGDYVLRSSRSMVPLTEVELVHTTDPEFRHVLPVLILNAKSVTRMHQADQPDKGEQARQADPAPAGPARPAAVTAPEAATAADAPATSDPMAALTLLLDAGLLDMTEFQAKRAELVARGRRR